MPQDLAALLVEEGAVSKADMDRAVARQAQLGGALDTALLELELIGEGHLLSFLAHVAALPAAPPGAFREIDARARRVFPAKVAERHRLAPFALDGRELSVVAAHPVDAAAIDEIGFMLSLTLVPHVGIEWRVHDLIHRLYGGQLSARLAKLADAALEIAPPPPEPVEPSAPVEPEPASPAPTHSVEEAFFAAGETAGSTPKIELPPHPALSPGGGEEKASGEAAPSAGGGGAKEDDETSFADFEPERPRPSGFGPDGSEPAEPLLAALELAVEAYDALWVEPGAEPEAARSEPPEEPGTSAVPSAGDGPAAAAPEGGPQAPPSEEAPPEEGEEVEEPLRELDRSAPPRWSIDDARAALAAARHRDEVVITALRFTRDFFEFSALFAVTRDAVVGHDALGSQEDERARCRGTAIYANDPGIVKTVLETRAPYLGPASRDVVGTANILDGLWRGTPRTVLLYPILLADRPVAVLYADNGEAPVSARRLGDLLLFLSTAGSTFERIIRSRKKRPRRAAPRPAPSPPPAVLPEPGPEPEWMAGPRDAAEIEQPPHPALSPGGGEGRFSVGGALSSAVGEGMDSGGALSAAAGEGTNSGVTVSPAAGEAMDPSGTDAAVGEQGMNPIPSRVDGAMAALLSGAPATPDGALTILDLVLDSDPGVAAAAREALTFHRRESAVKPLPERLRSALLSGVGERPVLAARALGALRDVASIPILIQALETGSRQGADAAAEALTGITLQRYGASPQKWLKWWKENRGRSRAEWLFAALNSPDRELRLAASGELRAAGEPPVRYSADLPSAELEAASRAWWVWWSRQGFNV